MKTLTTMTRNVPTAMNPPLNDHYWGLVIQLCTDLVSVVRLGYHLPEAEFEVLLDRVYKNATQTVLDRLRG